MDIFITYLRFAIPDHLIAASGAHAAAVGISVLLSSIIGITLGCFAYRRRRLADISLAVAGTIITIPSFALFALLVPFLGFGWPPTIVALTAYGVLPILRNTITGLQGVDSAVTDSAQGVGLSSRQRLFRIELPLASPVIIAGVRVSTLILLGIAAIAAIVAGPGLGEDIFSGLARLGSATALYLVLSSVMFIVMLAIAFDIAFLLFRKFAISKGIRQ
ncbi:MAG: ABC transporter permease [Actinobacteria bacterium]|jgi:osmoprotectant transport system permease protein|nr:ABC transporter permease [Actinomycetota bacterium]